MSAAGRLLQGRMEEVESIFPHLVNCRTVAVHSMTKSLHLDHFVKLLHITVDKLKNIFKNSNFPFDYI